MPHKEIAPWTHPKHCDHCDFSLIDSKNSACVEKHTGQQQCNKNISRKARQRVRRVHGAILLGEYVYSLIRSIILVCSRNYRFLHFRISSYIFLKIYYFSLFFITYSIFFLKTYYKNSNSVFSFWHRWLYEFHKINRWRRWIEKKSHKSLVSWASWM